MAAKVILVEATPRRAADGVVQTVRLAGGGATVPYHYGGQHWLAGIPSIPPSTATLAFDGSQLGGGGIPDAIEIMWAPAGNRRLADIAKLFWPDAPITVRIGAEGAALPPIQAAGLVLDTTIDAGALTIKLADVAVDLKRPLLVDRFGGTGGVDGPDEWKDRIKTRAWGRCWNVPGAVIDKANNIWCFGDPGRAWLSFDAVRDQGAPTDPATLTTLVWQGSVAATFDALRTAPATQGGGVCCPSIACVKWWSQNAGALHADIRGEIGTGYVETAPEIAARVVAARSTLAFADGEVAGGAAARPAPFGWRCASETTTAAAAVSEILGDVALSWVIVGAQIVLRPWEWAAPARRARSEAVARKEVQKPVATRKLGYRRNQAPMARGDLAEIVFATDVLFDDGSSAADLAAELARAFDDNWLSKGEKPALVREWGALESSFNAIDARFAALGSPADTSAARDAAAAAIAALASTLANLAPAWDNADTDTPINGPALNAQWIATRDKVEQFAAAIQGRAGADGASAPALLLTNEAAQLPSTSAGVVTSYELATTSLQVWIGGQEVTSQFALGPSAINPNTLSVVGAYPNYQVNGGFGAAYDDASITFEVSGTGPYAGITLQRVFSLSKSKAGANGTSPPLLRLETSSLVARYDKDGAQVTGDIQLTATRTNIADDVPHFHIVGFDGTDLAGPATAAQMATYPDAFSSTGPDQVTLKQSYVNSAVGHGGGFRVSAQASTATDTISVAKVQDGATGANAPLLRSQWSIDGVSNWHDNYFGADAYKRDSNDNGATWGPAYRAIGEAGTIGDDGTSPSIVFVRSPTLPATPADNSGNPPSGWSDGPPTGTDLLWQSKATFKANQQLTSWSAPVRITGDAGSSPLALTASVTSLSVNADYTGTAKDGQLPRVVKATMSRGTADISSTTAWAVVGTNCTATIDASGYVTVSAAIAAGYLDITGTVDGTAYPLRIPVAFNKDAAPPQTPTIQSAGVPNSAVFGYTYQQQSVVTVAADAGGNLRGILSVTYQVGTPSSGVRNYTGQGKLAYRVSGSTGFSDFPGGAVVGTNTFARGGTEPDSQEGTLYIDQSLTGLSPGVAYDIAFFMVQYSGANSFSARMDGTLVGRQP